MHQGATCGMEPRQLARLDGSLLSVLKLILQTRDK